MNSLCLVTLACACLCSSLALQAAESSAVVWRHQELRRWPAAEANQGVAVDEQFFYAITNHAIGKYRKDTGERVGGWAGEKGGRIIHLNAGVVREGRLYAAHSNFPHLPMVNSVEVWDTATMEHVVSHKLSIDSGSLTWVDFRDKHWFACFANYAKDKSKTGRGPSATEVVQLDAQWQRKTAWTFPSGMIARFRGNSCSGGAFGPSGHLFATGHDAKELYVLDFPATGSVLEWKDTVSISAEGQAFAWDASQPGILYSISRHKREVIVSRVAETVGTKHSAFEMLFDGKSLKGWSQKGNWIIEDGALFRREKGGDITYTVRPVPDDFELRFEWKVSKGCNSGVYYRPGQYEYQILDNANSPYGENPRQSAASLFFCMAPCKDATKPFGEWNEGRIVCKGSVIQHWLNNEKVMDFDYTDPRWSKEVELLRIRGGNLTARGALLRLQDHGLPVWYRNVRWRMIPETEQLYRSDFSPMPIPEAALKKEQERVRQMLKARGQ